MAADNTTVKDSNGNEVTNTDPKNKDINANITGKKNKVTDSSNAEIVGDNNTVTNKAVGEDGSVRYVRSNDARIHGSGNTISASRNQQVIGDNNTIMGRDDGTVTDYQHPEGREPNVSDLTIGRGNFIRSTDTYRNEWDSLKVIGNNNRADFNIESAGGPAAGIVIGDNQNIDGIQDSIVIGSLSPSEQQLSPSGKPKEKNEIGDLYSVGANSIIIGYHTKIKRYGEGIVVGNRSQGSGIYETIMGSRSIIGSDSSDPYSGSGAMASIYGAFNKIEDAGSAAESAADVDGVGNSINGSLNITSNARGTMIMGVGNTVTHAKGPDILGKDEDTPGATGYWVASGLYGASYYAQGADTEAEGNNLNIYFDEMRNSWQKYMETSGGAVSVFGNSNNADYAIRSQILGTGNTLQGSETDMSAYNTVSGFANTGTNIKRSAIVGTGNTLKNGEDNVVIGDYHNLENGKHNVILGSMDYTEKQVTKQSKSTWAMTEEHPDGTFEYTVTEQVPVKDHTKDIENAVMVGYNTDATVDGGVALGSDSIASTEAGKEAGKTGYDAKGKTHAKSDNDYAAWVSTDAAVSVGGADREVTYDVLDKDGNPVKDKATGKTKQETQIVKSTRQITNVAAGKELTDAVNVAQLKSAQVHYYSMNPTSDPALGEGSNYNNDGATGNDAIAIGPSASAKGNHSLALGYGAQTIHSDVTNKKGDTDDNTAIGYSSQAGYRSTALGYNSKATSWYDVALGTDALADKNNSTAVGMNAQATGNKATALGSLAKVSGESATAVGEGASALADYSSAVGQGAIVEERASKGTALGYQAKVLTGAENSMALGASSQVSGGNSIAIGTEARVTSVGSVAIGKGATVSLSRSVALGDGSIASTKPIDVSSITIPNLNRSYTVSGNWPVGIVSVGTPTSQRTITNVAAGRVTETSTDAVNGSELYAVATEAAKHATVKAAENSHITVNNKGENTGKGIEYTIGLNTDGLAARTDGLKFAGDDGQSDPGKVISRKLNEQLNIIGGATATVDANNIGVVKKDDNTLNIRLAQNITGLTSLQATTITSGKVTVNGQHDVITGLSNTEWNEGQDYSQSTKAATEAQIQKAMKQAAADANDIHIQAGDYAVGTITDKNGQSVQGVSMDVIDKTGKVGTVRITDVAKASDVGDVTGLNTDIKKAEGKTTVVDAVNNVDNKVGNLEYSSTKYVKKGEDVTTSIGKLDEAIKNASEAAGKHTTVSTTDSNLSVKNIAGEGEAANYQISMSKDLKVDSVTAANKITTKDLKVTGSATIGKVTINADGKGTIGGLNNKTWDAANITSGQAATEDQLQAATKNAVNYDGDDSKTVTLREDTTIKNVANTTIEEGSKNAVNAGTVYNETRVAKDGTFIRQANTAGENLTALDHQVTANTESIYHINNRVSNLDNRVNKVGAGAAALAALHPLDFDPDDKWDFAVGYGNYRNANSVAFGAFYRPNEDTMFSLGTNFGNGENMFNAGLSFKIGQGGSGITTSKTAMAKTISSLKDTVHKQDQKIEGLENVVDTQDKKIAELEALVKEQGEMIRQYVGKK